MDWLKRLFGIGKMQPEQFWQWLQDNLPSVNTMESPKGYIKAAKLCRATFGDVVLEMQPGDPPVFTLSADGVKEAIPRVMRAAQFAPKTDAFKVVTFRQPAEDGFALEVAGQRISADSVLVTLHQTEANGKLAISLYIPLPITAKKDELIGMGFLMLDHTLGEYVVMKNLADIWFLHYSQARPGSISLSEFREKYLADAPTSP